MSYTKGPWSAKKIQEELAGIPLGERFMIMTPNSSLVIAEVCIQGDHEGNANLISASPELLEALTVATNMLDIHGGHDLKRFYSVIAKAKGAQS